MINIKTIINFSGHDLSDTAIAQLKNILKDEEVQVDTYKVSLSRKNPLFTQVLNIMKKVPNLNSGEQPVVILPGLPIAAILIMPYIHGVHGCFPKVVELLRNPTTGVWEVNDIHDLEFYRHGSRRNR